MRRDVLGFAWLCLHFLPSYSSALQAILLCRQQFGNVRNVHRRHDHNCPTELVQPRNYLFLLLRKAKFIKADSPATTPSAFLFVGATTLSAFLCVVVYWGQIDLIVSNSEVQCRRIKAYAEGFGVGFELALWLVALPRMPGFLTGKRRERMFAKHILLSTP